MDLNATWYALVWLLLVVYAVLDGFDLGVGVWHLWTRHETGRRTNLAAIAPFWDGNEVWLLAGGGALFAAFPPVYATVFSGFYLAFVLLLLALILRAVSLEFRGKVDAAGWRRACDLAFGLGSLAASVLFGVALGNLLRGLAVDAAGVYRGGFLALLNPYALLCGCTSLAFFLMQGAAWLALKTEGEERQRARRGLLWAWAGSVVLLLAGGVATRQMAPQLLLALGERPALRPILLVVAAAAVAVPLLARTRRAGLTFASTSAVVAASMALAAGASFPVFVRSSLDPAWSLTAYNASSSPLTLKVMLVIAALGMPFVAGYTVWVYRIFRGPVRTESHYD